MTIEGAGLGILGGMARALSFRPRPDVVEWSRQLVLPARASQSRPGAYRLDDFPYVPEILRAIVDPRVRQVTGVIGTQGAKTQTFMTGLLYLLDQDPGNTLIGIAKDELARSFSRERLQPIIDSNPVLARHKLPDTDLYKTLEMAFDRATWVVAGTQSSNNLVSRPCRYVYIDEAQRAGAGAVPEAMQRTKTFPHTKKELISGTPDGEGEPWASYLLGSQERWAVPCGHCREGFEFEFPDSYDPKQEWGLRWDAGAKRSDGLWDEVLVKSSAVYGCPRCGEPMKEGKRLGRVKEGGYERHNEAASSWNRSFQVPSLCTPDVSFGEAAWQFLKTTQTLFGLKEYIEGYWARPYKPPGRRTKDGSVEALKSSMYSLARIEAGERLPWVPTLISLCGDPGEAVTHYSIAAHHAGGEFSIVGYGTVLAPEDLLEVVKGWSCVDGDGRRRRIDNGLVDAGDFTKRIYQLCAASGGVLWPSKGSDAFFGTINQSNVKDHPGLILYTYVDYAVKRSLYLDTIEMRKAPLLHFPSDSSPEFIRGHCGQELQETRTITGVRKRFKVVADDHFGDCSKLHRVITWVLGLLSQENHEDTKGTKGHEGESK